jgi:DNA-binding LacI/PurR family transcriptional regulator
MPDSGYFLPPLTTVRQDFGELGRRSLALLLDQLALPYAERSAEQVVVAPDLVVRSSTAPPPSLPRP